MPKPPKSHNNYYPFGSSLNTRSFSAGSGFRFGFNTQEKDKEVYNNNETYTATFWEIDSRLGRRFNIDIVYKPDYSGYSYSRNAPIAYNDINGGDDIFSPTGMLIKQTKKGSAILIQVDAKTLVQLNNFNVVTALDRLAVINIAKHYADQLKINVPISISQNEANTSNTSGIDNSIAFTITKYKEGNAISSTIYIKLDVIGSIKKVSNHLGTSENFKNVLIHEYEHVKKNKNSNSMKSEFFDHMDILLAQVNHISFANTTIDFKKNILSNLNEYFEKFQNDYNSITEEDAITKFNTIVNNINKKIAGKGIGKVIIKSTGFDLPEQKEHKLTAKLKK